MRILRRLKRTQKAAMSVEFAFVAPVMIILMVGALEFAMIQFLGSLIESAVLEASRYGATGYTQTAKSRDEVIRERVNEWAMGLIDAGDISINTQTYPSFEAVGEPEPYDDLNLSGGWETGEPFVDVNGNGTWDQDMGEAGLGGPGDVVLYEVGYKWGLLTALLKPLIGDVTFRSTVAVRNEPY